MEINNNIKICPNIVKNNSSKSNKINNNNCSGITHSIYNSCPVGANYFVPSFGLNNPQAALYRSQKLKEQYAQKGLNYLLSNEAWSDKKIFKALDRVGKGFDKLFSDKKLSKESLNQLLGVILPATVASGIVVKDFKDMGRDLVMGGYTTDEALEAVQTYAGFSNNMNGKTEIYVPVNREINDTKDMLNMKSTFLHELKHALTNNCTNVFTNDKYKFKNMNQETMLDETKYYNQMFMKFERIFQTLADGSPVNLNKDALINLSMNTNTDVMYNSEADLLKDMEKEINNIIKAEIENSANGQEAIPKLIEYGLVDEKTIDKLCPDKKLTDDVVNEICNKNPKMSKLIKNIVKQYKLPDDAFSSKVFWEFLQHRAMDERQAYTTDSELREVFGSKKQPVDYELQSLMYGEMEKFFRMKAKEAKN